MSATTTRLRAIALDHLDRLYNAKLEYEGEFRIGLDGPYKHYKCPKCKTSFPDLGNGGPQCNGVVLRNHRCYFCGPIKYN